MNPIVQCNHYNNRNCKESTYKNKLMSELPCRTRQEPPVRRYRLIEIAIWRELVNWGEVRNVSRLRGVIA